MLIPSSFHIGLWALLAGIGLLGGLFTPANTLWQILAGLCLGSVLIDGLLAFRRPVVTLKRQVRNNLPVTASKRRRTKVM